ncbi:MAG: SDR family oxidoreductase [Actinomycetota bacterium]|nr:SDR family oxidoreductase [Actinomycetota bacterium]
MGALDGRVAIITGAGRGVGREHALFFAKEGASVVVNDLGAANDGSGSDVGPAQQVADEIIAAGGQAVANTDDVASTEGAQNMVDQAVAEFGDLNILVNNAGILRDRMLVNMSDADWDDIIRVTLRGHFAPTRAAAQYWRVTSKERGLTPANIVNTSSTSGLFGNVGQTNYGAAKSGLGSFTHIAQMELERYGVIANAIAPSARTRLTLSVPGAQEREDERLKTADLSQWDPRGPENISPFVGWLSTADCPSRGRTYFVQGGAVYLFQPWAIVDSIEKEGLWTIDELNEKAAKFATYEFNLNLPY